VDWRSIAKLVTVWPRKFVVMYRHLAEVYRARITVNRDDTVISGDQINQYEHCRKSAGRHRPGDLPLFDRIGRSAATGNLLDMNAIEEGLIPIKTPAGLCCGKSSVPPQAVHLLQPSLHL